MWRTLTFATVFSVAFSALLFADSPRKKETIEPPAPEKPKIELPPVVKETPPPPKPKVEPAPVAKPIVEKPIAEPAPRKPKVEPTKSNKSLAHSPFTDPNLDKVTITKKKEEKKPVEKPTVKKPAVDKPRVAKKTPPAGAYVHLVTIPLKRSAPTDTADRLIADCHDMLGKIPTVRSVKAGCPALKDSKDYVKKDYNVGLLVLVDDHDGLMAYLNHPLHIQFVEKYKKHIDFESMRVVDFADEK